MSLRELPDAAAFYRAARDYCHLLEGGLMNDDAWGQSVLASLARLYACGHALTEVGLPDDAPDLPDEFDVTKDQYREVFNRLSDLFGSHAGYWCYFDPTEPPDAKEEPVFGLLTDDLADIYRDVVPGVRGWESQRDELLPTILFDWKIPLFHSHWGCHAVSAMRALHPLVYDRGIRTNA